MFTHNREGMDLNGVWKFCPDPMQRCRRQQWWRNPPKKDSPFPCWDIEGLWDIRVPGTWKTQFTELKWYDGHAVYMKEFEAKAVPPDHEAVLVFDGIIYASEIYLNGQLVGKHDWGYSPFTVRVTDTLQPFNRLFVLVENQLKADRVPGEVFDWNNDGGIINPARLVFVPRTHIDNFRTWMRLDGEQVVIGVEVSLQSRDAAAREDVRIRIPELKAEKAVQAGAGAPAAVEFRVARKDIRLWCPSDPKLYRTELATRFETVADDVGYREIRTEGQRILLNGRPIRLYGLCTHSEFKDTGRTATPAGIERMVAAVKELGVNFLRCAHYPYSDEFARAMDRAGLMRMEEVPAYWLPNMREEAQATRACGMLEEAIRRDWNRASIIMWSVSNECCWRNPQNPDEHNYPYWFRAAPMVRRLDPSRLITCAEAANMVAVDPVWKPSQADEFDRKVEEAGSWRLVHTDEWYQLFDVLAGNLYVGKPGEAATAYRRFVEMMRPFNKPVILSEFGSMSLRGADVPEDVLGSEVRHGRIIREAFDVFANLPEMTGYCLWCLNDVRVPIHWRWYNQGKGVFRYGLLDENWEKKRPFDDFREAVAGLKRFFGE